MVEMIVGTALPQSLQSQALATYVHRYTGDHKPAWAAGEWKDGTPYPLQFANDREWLANTLFPVDAKRTRLAVHPVTGTQCESSPTWPNNPELREAR